MIKSIYYLIANTPPPILALPTGTGVAEAGTLGSYITLIIRWALGLVGLVFFILILVAGFRYATAGGDASKTKESLSSISNAVIGLLIVGFSWVIANTVLAFVFTSPTN